MENWKNDLEAYFSEQKVTKKEIKNQKEETRKLVKHFMKGEVIPAFEALQKEFEKHKRELEIDAKKEWAAVMVKKNKHKEFVYEVNINVDDDKLMVSKSVYTPNKKGKLKLGVEGKIRNADNSLMMKSIKKEDIISDFLEYYKDATRVK
jgi:primosomal protein N''